MGLFTKKSKDALRDAPKLSQLVHSDLDILAPPALPAAGQRNVSGASVSSLEESKGYTLKGKLGLAKHPDNVFDGFDGTQNPEPHHYDDSIYSYSTPNSANNSLPPSRGSPQRPDFDRDQTQTQTQTMTQTQSPHGHPLQQEADYESIYSREPYEDSVYEGDFDQSGQRFESQAPQTSQALRGDPKPHPLSIPASSSDQVLPTIITAVQHGKVAHYTPEFKGAEFGYQGDGSASASPRSGTPGLYETLDSPVMPRALHHSASGSSLHSPAQAGASSGLPSPALHSPGLAYHQPEATYGDIVETAKGKSPTIAQASSFTTPPIQQSQTFHTPGSYATPGSYSSPNLKLDTQLPQSPATPMDLQENNPADHVNCSHAGPHNHSQVASPVLPKPRIAPTLPPGGHPGYPAENYPKKKPSVEVLPGRDLYAEAMNDYPYPLSPTELRSAPYPTCYYQRKGCNQVGPHDHSHDHQDDYDHPESNQDQAVKEVEPQLPELIQPQPTVPRPYPMQIHKAVSEPVEVKVEQEHQQEQEHENQYDRESEAQHFRSADVHADAHAANDVSTGPSTGTHTPMTELPLSAESPGDSDHLSRDFNRLSVSQVVSGMGLPLDTHSIASHDLSDSRLQDHHDLSDAGNVPPVEYEGRGGYAGTPMTYQVSGMPEPSQAEILRASYISTDSSEMGRMPRGGHSRGQSRSGTMMTGMSNMTGMVQGQNGVAYYPAPIPMNLKLPPLLSKKNRRQSKIGGSPNSNSPRKSSFSSTSMLDRPGNRSSFISPWSHTADGSLLHYEGFSDSPSPEFGPERTGRSSHRLSMGSRGSSPLKQLYLSQNLNSIDGRLERPLDLQDEDGEPEGQFTFGGKGNYQEAVLVDEDEEDGSGQDPYYNPEKRGRRRTMSLTSINVCMDKSEERDELEGVDLAAEITDMDRYDASANAFTRVHIDKNAIVPSSALGGGFGNGITPAMDAQPGTLVEELELRKKDKKAVRAHVNKSMHKYAADGTETPLIQQIHDTTSVYGQLDSMGADSFGAMSMSGGDNRRHTMMSSMTQMTQAGKDYSYEDPNNKRMSLLALDSLAREDYNRSYSKPGHAQMSKQYKASREDDEPLRVRKQRLKRQSEQFMQQKQLQENIDRQRLASLEKEKERQKSKVQRRNQFGMSSTPSAAPGKKGKVLIGPGGEVIRT